MILQFDGGSRGNPGPSGAGAVLMDESRSVLVEVLTYIGHATNNIAEYNVGAFISPMTKLNVMFFLGFANS